MSMVWHKNQAGKVNGYLHAPNTH